MTARSTPPAQAVRGYEAEMFREVSMIELKEVLRLATAGLPKKGVAAQLGEGGVYSDREVDGRGRAGGPYSAIISSGFYRRSTGRAAWNGCRIG